MLKKHGRTRRRARPRSTRKQKGGAATVDIVISRYKENLSWLENYKDRGFNTIHIYNKSDTGVVCPKLKPPTKCKVHNIANVGVCDHTYLYHIVHHYDSLAGVTIFAPGSADMDHKMKILDFTIGKVFETKNTVFNVYEFDIGVGEAMYNFTMDKYPTSHENNKDGESGEAPQKLADIRPFGAWYEANFPGEQTKKSSFFGVMAISREHIHKKPKSFYEGLLKQVNTDKFHEASHFMERAWTAMVHPVPDNCYYTSEIINHLIGRGQKWYKMMRRQAGGSLKLGVLAIFKNEAMGIREWIEHYLWQGVDTIVMLDNNSTDNWRDAIKGLEDRVIILPAPDNHAQITSYVDIGLPRIKEEKVNILAILDLDEFIFGMDGKNMKERVVEIFGKSDRPSQISCGWTIFGSSGHKKQPASIRKSFTSKKKNLGKDTKSIVWLDDIVDFSGQVDEYPYSFHKGVNLHAFRVSGKTIECPPGLQLNHYTIQSEEFFKTVKMARGRADTVKNPRNMKYFKDNDFNEETDTRLANIV